MRHNSGHAEATQSAADLLSLSLLFPRLPHSLLPSPLPSLLLQLPDDPTSNKSVRPVRFLLPYPLFDFLPSKRVHDSFFPLGRILPPCTYNSSWSSASSNMSPPRTAAFSPPSICLSRASVAPDSLQEGLALFSALITSFQPEKLLFSA